MRGSVGLLARWGSRAMVFSCPGDALGEPRSALRGASASGALPTRFG